MGRLRVNTIKNSTGTSGPIFTGPAEFSSTAHIVLPKGTTAERPSSPSTGALRYNTDTSTVEYWNGTSWVEVTSYDGSVRGVFGGGEISPTTRTTIDYISIQGLGNAISFGDLTTSRKSLASCSSSTRGVFGGGDVPGITNVIDYITLRSVSDTLSLTNNYVRRLFVLRTPAVQRDGLTIALSVHVVVVHTRTTPVNDETTPSRLLTTR